MTEQYRNLIDEIWEKVDRKLSKVAIRSRNKIPYSAQNGTHDDYTQKDVTWWTNGFWGGMMWLLYSETKNTEYRLTAESSEKLMDAALANYDGLHHDVGFMWHILSGASYRLTGNKNSRLRNLYAASVLASRYNIDGKYIRAWNGDRNEGWSIIDCMMNIPLLYWASEEIGDDRFKKIAKSHADMSLRDHIRADGSINHIVEHNTDTGEVVCVYGGQGYSETSCWTRGLSWAVYGMALSYRHTKKKEYLDAAIKCAEYFMSNIAKTDYMCPVDFMAPQDGEYYDSTAGVITACGLIEIASFLPEKEAERYIETAINVIKTTDEKFCNYNEEEDYLVGMGTERYPVTGDMNGVHIPIIYGDFFFVEALTKLRESEFCIW